jgi:DnaJ-class molecular chaperone
MDIKDAAACLGVDIDTPLSELKEVYQELALYWHPERCTDLDAKQRFQDISLAYAQLVAFKKETTVNHSLDCLDEEAQEMKSYMQMFVDLVGAFSKESSHANASLPCYIDNDSDSEEVDSLDEGGEDFYKDLSGDPSFEGIQDPGSLATRVNNLLTLTSASNQPRLADPFSSSTEQAAEGIPGSAGLQMASGCSSSSDNANSTNDTSIICNGSSSSNDSDNNKNKSSNSIASTGATDFMSSRIADPDGFSLFSRVSQQQAFERQRILDELLQA